MVTENAAPVKSDESASFLRASRGGNSEKVLEYLKNGTDINTCNANGLNALHLSSKEGHVHIVQELLARGAKIDASTKKGNTGLHIASLAGQEEVVKILVSHSASVNVQSQNGFTPLYMAAQENHDGVVRFLLASGASQSLATEDGFTPLAVALQQGHDKVVAVLLENDTRGKVRLPALHIAAKKDDTKAAALLLQNDHNPDVTSKSGFTPLHISSHYGNEKIAAVLLQRGADVNYSAKHNITPLHVAAKWGKSNMVSLLLENGANLESRTRDGLTPLHCAARSGHENVVDMMLARGAPISAKTKNGLAPLHMSSQGDHVDAARILLHHKAPVDEVTVDYLTALHVAAHCGHVRVAKLLLDRKADPNSRALNGFTPLHIACKKNRIKVVELLLKYGASIEATTESGLTPLHVASFMGCMNIVIFLIQHQASPDEATVRGETPLHLAARANQTDIIRILLRNGAKVDATAREQQTPLHIASRLGNVDIVVLLLQSGAKVDAVTKDLYTALHIAAKEGQEEVAAILLEHSAKLDSTTKKGFTPLHLAAKYGNIKVAKLLLAKETAVDAEGKNGVTPLHVAVHYDNTPLAALLLDRGASPHAAAKNGYTPLHISAKKNQLDIARTLVEYGAKVNGESKAGFTPLHLAAQEGHAEMADLLIRSDGSVNAAAKNGLTPLHLCAQEDRVEVAKILVDSGCNCDLETKAGYTPLHVAAHFGQVNMVRLLLNQGVRVDVNNELGYTPLHQAAQQGHSQIVNLLLEAGAQPNNVANNGQTALSIAQKLGYISVVETLKVVTDEVVTTTTTTVIEEKYRVLAPESMQETFMSDSEDEGGDENIQDQSYKYLTTEEMKGLGDDSINIDVTNDEKEKKESLNRAAEASIEKKILEMERTREYGANTINNQIQPDNIEIPTKPPVHAGFLVSFMVDARGGAMRGCRHSGVRVIIPPRKAPMPMRVTCRYLKKDKLIHPPPLNEGEALASRVLELGPAKANFLGPVIIEVPHFASLRGKEREIIIMRSDDGEKWREHSLEATEEAVQEVLQESFDGEDSNQLEDLNTNRITRILTTDFPMYFAVISRIRQELHYIGPEGGLVNSSVVPQVQAMFPQGALTKKIKVGLQAQPIPSELTAKLLGNRVAVSPIVTVEPRRRKFHKPITLTIPVPVAAGKGMINQYSGDTPTLRLLCSITGGTTRAQWEDVTGSTPLTFLNDTVSFTTTVSARFWLMDCRNVPEATKMATSLYKEAIHVPFMAKFLVFSKRHEQLEARLRVFCMTDDREDKTLEHQEHFHEVAKSRDVEVLEGKVHYLEFSGNLHPVTKSGDQLTNKFLAFRENRLPLTVRVKDPHNDPIARISFYKEGRVGKGEASPAPICNLNLALPRDISPEHTYNDNDIMAIQAKYSFLREAGYGKFNTIQKADLRISDISNLLGKDWIKVGRELGIEEQDINLIMTEYPDNDGQQAMVMLRLWLNTCGSQATGNTLKDALAAAGRQDIIDECTTQLEEVTNHDEMILAESQLQENGFSSFKDGLNGHSSKSSSLKRDFSMDVSYDQQEMIQEHEHMEQITESAEDEETKYLAEEKVFKEATTFSQSSQSRESSQIREVKESFSSQEQSSFVIQESRVEERMEQMNLEEASEYKIESRKESTFHETKVEESKMSATTADGTTTTQESLVQESQIEEILMEEVDGSRTTVSAVEAHKGVLETKDGEVITSDFETFAHSQQTVTDTDTLLAKAGDSVDMEEQKEEETKEGGIKGLKETLLEDNLIQVTQHQSGSEFRRGSTSSYSDHSPKASPKGSSRSSSRSSSGASSHGSSNDDLQDLKETERELLDEMIVRDVPESSTDPVRQFEDSKAIEPISEENAPTEQCKDLISEKVTTHTSSKSSLDPLSSFLSLNEMPSKDDEETSPTSGGLAAPDSKDSLEVQLYSVCDDISENLSGKEESVEDIRARVDRQVSSQSEGDDQLEVIEEIKDDDEPSRLEITAEKVQPVSGQSSSREDSFEMFESSEVDAAKSVLGEAKVEPDVMLEGIMEKFEKIETEGSTSTKVEQKVEERYTVEYDHTITSQTFTTTKSRRSSTSSSSEEGMKLKAQESTESNEPAQLIAQESTESTEAVKLVMQESTESSEAVKLVMQESTESTEAVKLVVQESTESSEAVKLIAQESTESTEAVKLVMQESTESTEAVKLVMQESTESREAVKLTKQEDDESNEPLNMSRRSSSSSSSSEDAVKLSAQESIESNEPAKLIAQESTDSSEAVKLVAQESTESSEAVHLESHSNLIKQSSADSSERVEIMTEVSTDSSISTKQENTVKKEIDDSPVSDLPGDEVPRDKTPEHSDSSDTEEEDERKVASSSEYDTSASAKPNRKKRPDSIVSDTSSDYDSSAPGSRRPQSFVLEDEYDVITEEETAEVRDEEKKADASRRSSTDEPMDDDDSSDESFGHDRSKIKKDDGISSLCPPPSSVSLLPSSLTPNDLHADLSMSLDVAESSVIHSNTLEEIEDIGSAQPSPLTRSSDSNQENKSQEASTK